MLPKNGKIVKKKKQYLLQVAVHRTIKTTMCLKIEQRKQFQIRWKYGKYNISAKALAAAVPTICAAEGPAAAVKGRADNNSSVFTDRMCSLTAAPAP